MSRSQIAGEQATPAGLNWQGRHPPKGALAAATAYLGLKGTEQKRPT